MTMTADETVTEEAPPLPEDEATKTDSDSGEDNGEEAKDAKNKDRDFTKVRPLHEKLAAYVNEHAGAGVAPVTPNQVKAILYLRPDFNNSPEQVAERQARKDRKAAEEARYEGMTDEQKKAAKASEKATAQAERYAERARAAQAEAERLAAEAKAKAANGGDVASKVEAAQSDETGDDSKRKIGKRR